MRISPEACRGTWGIMKRILIVEDEVGYSNLLKRYLARFGYQVEETQKGSEAMIKLFQMPFDLVLLDYYLLDMKGDEVCKDIRKEERFKDLPVIMITTQHYNLDEDFFKRCGANEVFYKPLSYEKLGEAVKNCLGE